MASSNRRRQGPMETLEDLAAQRQAFLESELTEVRYELEQARNLGCQEHHLQLNFVKPIKYYLVCVLVLFSLVGFYEELLTKNSWLNKTVKAKLGHNDFHAYLARESIRQEMPYDERVAECDYRTMTAKRFFNDFVK